MNTPQTLLAQRISMVSGVAQVQVFGSQKYAVRVEVDPDRSWRRAKIGIDEVAAVDRDAEREPADGDAVRAGRKLTRGDGPAAERVAVPADDRRCVAQRQPGAA